ncbi:hypothetical protein D3C78_980590 [compost metagenome]
MNVQTIPLAGCQPNNYCLIRMCSEHLSRIFHFTHLILNRREAPLQIKLSPVALASRSMLQMNMQITERQIRLRIRPHHFLGNKIGFLIFALLNKPAQLGQQTLGSRVIAILRITGPKSVLVQLDSFMLYAAKNHPAKSAIPDRKRFRPKARSFIIMQLHLNSPYE